MYRFQIIIKIHMKAHDSKADLGVEQHEQNKKFKLKLGA